MLLPEAAIQARFPSATLVEHRDGGANGDIYLVRLPEGDRAVKVVDPDLTEQRRERELEALRRISSAYVVAYRGHGLISHEGVDYPYIEMDWVDAPHLEDQLMDVSQWPIEERVRLIAQICEGIDAIGAQGVVHRDLKPLNIMVGANRAPIIVDLGWARLVDLTSITPPAQGTGTTVYNSPEQLRHEGVDPRSDVFAAGIVAYQVLTGRHPFQAADGTYNIAALLAGRPLVGLLTAADVPEEVAAVVERMLAADRARRPRRGAHAAEEITRALVGATPPLAVFPRPCFLPYLGLYKRHVRTGFFSAVQAHGSVIELRVNSCTRAATDLGRAPAAFRLVDPSSMQSFVNVQRNVAYKTYPTLPLDVDPSQLDTAAGALAFASPFLTLEQQLGASVLVAPYIHANAGQMENVERSLRCAEQAISLAGEMPLLAGVSLDAVFIEDDMLRGALLDRLSAVDISGFFILLQDGRADFSQVDRPDLLHGLRDLVEALRSTRQVTFFARIGSVGIPLVVHGAGGFSTGVEARSMHVVPSALANAPATVAQRPISRYYERTLFTFLKYTDSRQARTRTDPTTGNPALGPCACTFCGAGPDLMLSTTPWSDERAARHLLWAMTQDVDELRSLPLRERPTWLGERLTAAINEREGLRRATVVVLDEGRTPNYTNWQAAFL